MDSPAGPTPAKKRCILTNRGKMRPQECVREFQLPRQFPSTVKQALQNGIVVGSTLITRLDIAETSSNAENRVPYNLQKLRILSPNGRDLGEFNVEMRSADPLKGNTITITKPKSIGKPLPLSPVSIRALPRILKQGTAKMPRSHLMKTISCSRNISFVDNTSMSHHHQQSMNLNKILNGQSVEGKTETQMCSNSNNADKEHSVDGLSSKHFICQNGNGSNQKYVVHDGVDDTDVCDSTIIQETIGENNEVSSATETQLYKKTANLPYSTNNKKLTINSSDRNNISLSGKNLKVSKGKCIATIKKTENGKIVTSLKSAANLMQRYNPIDKNSNQNGISNSSRKSLNNDEFSNDRVNSLQIKSEVVSEAVPETKTQNIMTIIPNNKVLLFNQKAAVVQKCTPLVSASIKNITGVIDHDVVKHDTQCDDKQNKGSKAGSRNDRLAIDGDVRRVPELQRITDIGSNVQSNVQSKDCPKNSPQKDLTDQLSIIKKAMDSVRDNKLRELALKALADCGIGIERYVPIRPPEEHKAVHDTQVQTAVFGLLDPKSFILINKDLDDIHRLNQITLHDIPDKNLSLADNLLSNNFVSIDSNVIEGESPFDLDSFMEQFWKETSGTLNVKETISVTGVRCNSLLKQLQTDLECVKRYDQNGMLNIHNAVISDSVYLVQRQLTVLEYCKQSVDTLTEDGMTSLELAIKYNVCNEIVELLLDAGAQPVIPKSLRESALIIASKRSSPLLSMLVSHISDSKLLDQIDSEGFAAIHYCTIHGNLQGVKTLLSAGATIDLKDKRSGRTPLFHAIDNGHTSVMRVLLKAGAVAYVANYSGQTPLSIISNDPKSLPFRSSLRKDAT